MSTVTQTISAIESFWSDEKTQKNMGVLNDLVHDLKDIDRQIADIREKKSGLNPLKILGNAWARTTKIPPFESRRKDLQIQHDQIKNGLVKISLQHADQILAAKAHDDPKIAEALDGIKDARAPLEQTQTSLREIKVKTRAMLETIRTAYEEASSASSWETIDMFGSNAGVSLISHFQTSDAAEHLKKVGTELKDYKAFMDKAQGKLSSLQLTPLRVEGIEEIAEWDLWMGVLDIDLVSIFTSWKNKEQLETAMEKLEALKGNIEPFVTKADKLLSNTSHQIDKLDKLHVSLRENITLNAGLPENFYRFFPSSIKPESLKPPSYHA